MEERIMTVLIQSPVIIATFIMPIPLTESEFKCFREQLYNQFEHCSDSAMDLLDALCSNIQSPSVVQLSLNPLYRRGYSALYKALGGNLFAKPSKRMSEKSQSLCIRPLNPPILGDFQIRTPQSWGAGGPSATMFSTFQTSSKGDESQPLLIATALDRRDQPLHLNPRQMFSVAHRFVESLP
jgi:hypothetical protein